MKELSWPERGRLWLRLGIRLVLTLLALWGLVRLGPPLLSLFMPFVLALILSWLLNPLVRFLQQRLGLSRKLLSFVLILLIFAGVSGLLFALIYNIAAELVSLAYNWSSILSAIQSAADQLNSSLARFMALLPPEVVATAARAADSILLWLQETLPLLLSSAAARATDLAMGVPSFAIATVVFIMGAYFITADYPHIRYLATRHMSEGMRRFLRHVRSTAVTAFGGYVKAEFILSIGVFFILLVGFAVIGQPYGLLLAFLLAILDFIPIVGAGTVMVPWAVLDLFMGSYRHAIELMVIWGIIALFRRVGEPKAVGHQTGLPPVLSLVSIYVGMRLAGVLGMILGPVVVLVVINIGKSGVFDGVLADLSLAAGDISALLKGGSVPREDGDNSKIV